MLFFDESMTTTIYTLLLLFTLFILYKSGKVLQDGGKVLSSAGLSAVLVYTFNEGLRFGRGIDYNLYGIEYEKLSSTGYSDWDISFQYIARALIAMDVPWQGFVMLMSFIFIVATILLLRNFSEVLLYALPLFVLFTRNETQNMVRWYLGFSFVLIGLSYLLKEESRYNFKFWGFSIFACTFHLALLPLPIVFYLLHLRKLPLLSPLWVLLLYFSIAFFFQTDFMKRFVDIVNLLSMSLGSASERLANYGNRAEYWLTGGFAGTSEHSALPNMHELIFLSCLVIVGYKAVINKGGNYVFAYNMFVVGLLAYPLALQIELVQRFDQPFLFFRAIVLACIIECVFVKRTVPVNQLAWLFSVLIVLNMGRKIIITPFNGNPDKYLYVWDSHGKTYQSMYNMWISDMYNADAKKKRNK